VRMELLAGATASVLHEEIRSRRGLTYDLWGAATGYRDTGIWRIGMSTAPEHRDTVVELALELIAGAGFSDQQVALARRRAAALHILDAESTLEEVLRLGQHRLIGRTPDWTPRGHADALLRVGPGDVADCARQLLRRVVVATAGGPPTVNGHGYGREEEPWTATLSTVAGPS
jgi:predicted Zn-dependent peptidase